MARKPTGNPHWKALAVKLPGEMIEDIRRYTDLHGTTISDLIRESLEMRLHGKQRTEGDEQPMYLSPAMLAMLRRLANQLDAATCTLRWFCTDAAGEWGEKPHYYPDGRKTPWHPEYNGNTGQAASYAEPEAGHSILTESAPVRKAGRQRSPLGQQILDLLVAHPEGLTAEQMRGYLTPDKSIADILAGMRRLGTVTAEKEGRGWRYFAAL